jgi:FMN phosphatase YigB (HAD superfamily)
MEIFGHAPSTEISTFYDLNSIYYDLRDQHDFIVVSDEIGKSKPATLFFLSKFGCEIERVIFFNTYTVDSMWNDIDILLTANPNLLLNHPKDKKLIKYETEYNENVMVENKIKKIKELKEKIC